MGAVNITTITGNYSLVLSKAATTSVVLAIAFDGIAMIHVISAMPYVMRATTLSNLALV
jgi:hypothetical protein